MDKAFVTGAPSTSPRQHQISEADLPLHCPPDDTALWSQHPRVYLPIAAGETALCPYCGNRFFLPKSR
ncbi:MAG: zinc-finger domain-containing protein [Arenicellales bacterium]|jgi:uncharacterized Zn-finger protein|nr:zinc-finger domain-containing protein [Gammaproteobacteria bacterium]NDA15542.1 zinc-finger domain-containing protein [Gammaproteobacteria bacterium]NDG43935.1 zinc-finger domain-containing protein [Gammaproteobacteria bacterium]